MRIAASVLLFTTTLGPLSLSGQNYKVRDLGPIAGSPYSGALAINNHRTAVGYSLSGKQLDNRQPVLWRPSQFPYNLSIPVPAAVDAVSVNDAGVVLGNIWLGKTRNSYVWDPVGGAAYLPAVPVPGALTTTVSGSQINSNGYIAGNEYADTPIGPFTFPMVWKYANGFSYQVLPNPFPNKLVGAYAINNAGIVGGQLDALAALWDTGNGNAYKILGALPGDETAVVAALDDQSRFAVGDSGGYPNAIHAFLYTLNGWDKPGTFTLLADPNTDSQAFSVNHAGQVVGSAGGSGAGRFAFLWDQVHGLRNLNNLIPAGSAWELVEADGINNNGEIVGFAYLHGPNGDLFGRGFMLVQDDQPPVVNCPQPDGHWHAANVTLDCHANDAIAGLGNPAQLSFNLVTNVPAGVESANAATDAVQVCDAVGNCTSAGPVAGNRIDRKPPVITCGAADGVWHANNVFLACDAQDSGSGVNAPGILLHTTVAAGVETSNASVGPITACDRVGNCANAPAIGGNKIDRKPPTIAIGAPATGSIFTLGQQTFARYSCSDGGSGVATCNGNAPPDTLLSHTRTGARQFDVKASDKVGNDSQAAVNYSVTNGICATAQRFPIGPVAKIQLSLCDVNKTPVGGGRIAVTPTGLAPGGLQGQPASFTALPHGVYEFDLTTTKLAAGSYDLQFKAARDPIVHHVAFDLYTRAVGQ